MLMKQIGYYNMMNIRILNELVHGIAKQIPLINSFYTQSPYESWNVKEVDYGSISFVVTKTTTREQTMVYDAVLYYADRLTESKSNLDSIHSDAATVIQTIVGAINQSDDIYINIDYPVGITLFEQSFCDDLAGGYANITITVEGIGECFRGDINIPQIVATSAYYTKEEANKLFPFKNQLSKVAYSGSYYDIPDAPVIPNGIQYDELLNSLNEGFETLTEELKNKVSMGYFYDFVNSTTEGFETLTEELKNKVSMGYFYDFVNSTTEGFETLTEEVQTKLSTADFDEWADNIEEQIKNIVPGGEIPEGRKSSTIFLQVAQHINNNAKILTDKIGYEEHNREIIGRFCDIISNNPTIPEEVFYVNVDANYGGTNNRFNGILSYDGAVVYSSFSVIIGGTINTYGISTDKELLFDKYLNNEPSEFVINNIPVNIEHLALKSEFNNYYSKDEINNIIGDIDSVLNNILNEL